MLFILTLCYGCCREYLLNIELVDAGIKQMVELFDDFYEHDEKTAYIMSSDHGMTNWGR